MHHQLINLTEQWSTACWTGLFKGVLSFNDFVAFLPVTFRNILFWGKMTVERYRLIGASSLICNQYKKLRFAFITYIRSCFYKYYITFVLFRPSGVAFFVIFYFFCCCFFGKFIAERRCLLFIVNIFTTMDGSEPHL